MSGRRIPRASGCGQAIGDLELFSERTCQFWWQVRGQARRRVRVSTPFILERANPAKAGDAKRQTAGARNPVVAALPKGWAGEEPVRPATDGDRKSGTGGRTRPEQAGQPADPDLPPLPPHDGKGPPAFPVVRRFF